MHSNGVVYLTVLVPLQGMFLAISGHHAISSMLVGSRLEFLIIWSKFNLHGTRLSGCSWENDTAM